MELVSPQHRRDSPIDLFLAGGIRNCPDWQGEALEYLSSTDFRVANPRRAEGLATTGPEAAVQIAWERAALERSKVILFWFPQETLCPITLLELGVEIGRARRPLAIGTHPGYERRFDVEQQVFLASSSNQLLPSVIHSELEPTLLEAVEILDDLFRGIA